MSREQRIIAWSATAAILVSCVVIIALSIGMPLPGGSTAVPGHLLASRTPVEVPSLAIILACAGLAIAAATIGAAAAEPGMAGRRVLVALDLTLAGLGGLVLLTVGAVEVIVDTAPGANALVIPLFTVTGWLGLVCAVILPILVLARPPGRRIALPLVAALPFLALLASILLGSGQRGEVSAWVQAQFLDYPATVHTTSIMFVPIISLVGSAAGLIALLTLWQAATWSRATARLVGLRIARQADRWWWLLALLIGAKLMWLGLGISKRLPTVLGGTSDAWSSIRSDDLFSWFYVSLLAGAIGIWLVRRHRRVDDRVAGRTAGYAVFAFAAISFLLAAQPLLSPALSTVWPSLYASPPDGVSFSQCVEGWLPFGAPAFSACLANLAVVWQSTWWAAVILGAIVGGAVLQWRRPGFGGTAFLLALGAWALPRAIGVVRVSPPPELDFLRMLPAINAPQPETMDVAVTVLVALLAAAWWAGRQRRVGPGTLLLILVTSTLLMHASTILPSAPLALFLAVPVVFPVLYELAFDSEELNRKRTNRPASLLAWVGLRAFVLTLLATLVAVDIGRFALSTQARLGFVIFALPFAAIVVAAAIPATTRWQDAGQPESATSRKAGIGRFSVAAGIAAATVAVIAFASLPVQPAVASLYATGTSRLADLEQRASAAHAQVAALPASDQTGSTWPSLLMGLWRTESAWLLSHPPHQCAAQAWSTWQDVLDDYRELAVLLEATTVQPASASQSEIDSVNANLAALTPKVQGDLSAFAASSEDAREVCAAL